MGAAMPICAYPEIRPITKVNKPISRSVTKKVYSRPIRSLKRPKNNAPKGRTIKPAANVPKAAR